LLGRPSETQKGIVLERRQNRARTLFVEAHGIQIAAAPAHDGGERIRAGTCLHISSGVKDEYRRSSSSLGSLSTGPPAFCSAGVSGADALIGSRARTGVIRIATTSRAAPA